MNAYWKQREVSMKLIHARQERELRQIDLQERADMYEDIAEAMQAIERRIEADGFLTVHYG